MKSGIKWLVDPDYRHRNRAMRRLRSMPRYAATETDLVDDQPFRIVDAASFLSSYREIFQHEIYAFDAERSDPYIIDCGANVGQAIAYWKQRFPAARIHAFEPDVDVYEALAWNCAQRDFDAVELERAAVWVHENGIVFHAEGADAGTVMASEESHNSGMEEDSEYTVSTVRLRDYLDVPVDFLKLDIEGAETEVLLDCVDGLRHVQHLFVEYHSYVNQEQRIDELLALLRKVGFRIHIHPELTADRPFVQRLEHAGMDHRLNIFAYRR
jgi:FkbM family methyltransferase